MKDILLINVSGQDKPGVTSVVTEVLSSFEVTVLDIGQAVIHDQLNLGILAAVPRSEDSDGANQWREKQSSGPRYAGDILANHGATLSALG